MKHRSQVHLSLLSPPSNRHGHDCHNCGTVRWTALPPLLAGLGILILIITLLVALLFRRGGKQASNV